MNNILGVVFISVALPYSTATLCVQHWRYVIIFTGHKNLEIDDAYSPSDTNIIFPVQTEAVV